MAVEVLPVTVVVPVKNEERNLARCLACLEGFQEVVVVDSNSTDSTQDIAKRMGAKVVAFHWDGRFPKKRNWYLRNHEIKTPWVMFVDADEYINGDFKAELAKVLPNTNHVGFWLNYQNHFLGKPLRYGDTFRKLALFRPGSGEYEHIDDQAWSCLDMEVHEHPILNGSVGSINPRVRHEDFKGLTAYFDRHNQYSTWEARRFLSLQNEEFIKWQTFSFRQKMKYRMLNTWFLGPMFFIFSFLLKMGFRDGKRGFIFALCKMIYFLQIKMKIDELNKEV